ncbi:hypothetical protein [Pseudomonas sp. MIACH]|uniref:hypothetical protein n=1 Tax=Pseudomonas sp. MIACH TaxID=1078355 RepID=UPI000A881400|nr:hypothetical protein [Pseudomonas sp. MIACH]
MIPLLSAIPMAAKLLGTGMDIAKGAADLASKVMDTTDAVKKVAGEVPKPLGPFNF